MRINRMAVIVWRPLHKLENIGHTKGMILDIFVFTYYIKKTDKYLISQR
jgi:hypothetical protein